MKYLILFLLLFLMSCSTTKNYRSPKVWSNAVNSTEIKHNIEFDAVYEESNIYPPAKGICYEVFQLDTNNKQCVKFLTWEEYITKKGDNLEIIKLDYKYETRTMLIYVRRIDGNKNRR